VVVEAHQSGSAAGASRGAILAALRSSGTATTVDVLAAAVGLTVSTVRFHLGRLVDEGLVTAVAGSGSGPGRPKHVYRAVPPEAVDGAAAYRLLAGLLADELARLADPMVPVSAGRAWAARVYAAAPTLSRRPGEPDADFVVRQVVELFEEGGFAPVADATGEVIALHACPFMDLARVRPEIVCSVHLGLVRGLVDRLGEPGLPGGSGPAQFAADRVRVHPVLDGSGPCLVHLPRQRPLERS